MNRSEKFWCGTVAVARYAANFRRNHGLPADLPGTAGCTSLMIATPNAATGAALTLPPGTPRG